MWLMAAMEFGMFWLCIAIVLGVPYKKASQCVCLHGTFQQHGWASSTREQLLAEGTQAAAQAAFKKPRKLKTGIAAAAAVAAAAAAE